MVKTSPDYRRYDLQAGPVSPRGIPGHGAGFVKVDSDEHDESGHITEDLGLRVRMVDKRLGKLDLLRREALPPELSGEAGAATMVISWGSTYHAVQEALAGGVGRDICHLHFAQVYPLPPGLDKLLSTARQRIVVEGNAGGQFARLLERETGVHIDRQVLKYNGMPFAVEEIAAALGQSR